MGAQSFVETVLRNAITEVVQDQERVDAALDNAEQDINDQLAQTNN